MTVTLGAVGRFHDIGVNRVRALAKVEWEEYVVPGASPLTFTEIPPPVPPKAKGRQPAGRWGGSTAAATLPMPPALNADLTARLAGLLFPSTPSFALKDGTMPEPPEDAGRIAWALYWLGRGINPFPCAYVLGTPLAPPIKTADRFAKFTEWWTGGVVDEPNDIACYPDDHGLFVVEVHRFCEDEPKVDFSGAVLFSESAAGDRRYWFGGRCYSRLHALGRWVSVWGVGAHVALKPSATVGRIMHL